MPVKFGQTSIRLWFLLSYLITTVAYIKNHCSILVVLGYTKKIQKLCKIWNSYKYFESKLFHNYLTKCETSFSLKYSFYRFWAQLKKILRWYLLSSHWKASNSVKPVSNLWIHVCNECNWSILVTAWNLECNHVRKDIASIST